MTNGLTQYWNKEYILIAVAVICLVIYYYRKELNNNKSAKKFIGLLPVIGGLAFGFNTLINLTK